LIVVPVSLSMDTTIKQNKLAISRISTYKQARGHGRIGVGGLFLNKVILMHLMNPNSLYTLFEFVLS